MNSLEIREAKMQLIEMINRIELPLEVKRMMLIEIMRELENVANKEIDRLLAERKEKQEQEAKKDE